MAKFISMVARLAVVGVAAASAAGVVAAAMTREPVPVDRVPASIPAEGINLTDVIVLLPATQAGGLISSVRAVALARRTASTTVWRHAATLRATIPGPVSLAPDAKHSAWTTLRNEPAWVVTFTASSPQHVGFSPGALSNARHMAVVLDARTGRFVRGFYTA